MKSLSIFYSVFKETNIGFVYLVDNIDMDKIYGLIWAIYLHFISVVFKKKIRHAGVYVSVKS